MNVHARGVLCLVLLLALARQRRDNVVRWPRVCVEVRARGQRGEVVFITMNAGVSRNAGSHPSTVSADPGYAHRTVGKTRTLADASRCSVGPKGRGHVDVHVRILSANGARGCETQYGASNLAIPQAVLQLLQRRLQPAQAGLALIASWLSLARRRAVYTKRCRAQRSGGPVGRTPFAAHAKQ